jgi:hypothetical protein
MNLAEMSIQSEVVGSMQSHAAEMEIRPAHKMKEGLTLMERSRMYQKGYGYACLTMA